MPQHNINFFSICTFPFCFHSFIISFLVNKRFEEFVAVRFTICYQLCHIKWVLIETTRMDSAASVQHCLNKNLALQPRLSKHTYST